MVCGAQQLKPIPREVALKIIEPGMDSKQVIARLESERQALAVMDHPNIARVFDAGSTAAGLPYFAMELVDGVPITRYRDSKRLSLTERLELFARSATRFSTPSERHHSPGYQAIKHPGNRAGRQTSSLGIGGQAL